MKRVIAALLVICICVGLCACGSATTKDPLKDIKAGTDEYVKNTISKVISTSNGTGLTKDQIMDTLVITYSNEEVTGDVFSYIATYRITLGGSYYFYEFDVNGTLSSGNANISLNRNYEESAGSDTNYAETISISDKKEIAEAEAIDAIISYLQSTPGYTSYDVNSSKYKIGTISQGSGITEDHFTVNGTLYLYDKYGSLANTATFSVTVVIDDYGYYNTLTPFIN